MLHIAVHHDDQRRCAGQYALNHGRGQTAAAHPLQDADMALALRDAADERAGAVGAIVIDKDHLPRPALQHMGEALDQPFDIGGFVERWHDDRHIKRRGAEGKGGIRCGEQHRGFNAATAWTLHPFLLEKA